MPCAVCIVEQVFAGSSNHLGTVPNLGLILMSDVLSADSASSCFGFLLFFFSCSYAVCVCLTEWNKVATRLMWSALLISSLRLLWSISVTSLWGVKVCYLFCVCKNKATLNCAEGPSSPGASVTAVSNRELERKDKCVMTASSPRPEMVFSPSSSHHAWHGQSCCLYPTPEVRGRKVVCICQFCLGQGWLGVWERLSFTDQEVFVSFLLIVNNWL